MNNFLSFEKEVMLMILKEEPDYTQMLLQQYENSSIISRDFTGVGFFTDFEVFDKKLQLPNAPNFVMGNVNANISNLKHGAGFVLFIKDGFINVLEGYTYDEPWPSQITEYTLF